MSDDGLATWSFTLSGGATFVYSEIRWKPYDSSEGLNDWSGRSSKVFYSSGASQYQIPDLTPGTEYKAKLFVGVRQNGANVYLKSSVARFTPPATTPAPAPTVTAERGGGISATVSWTAYEGDDFSYYRFVVCDDSQYDGASCSGTVYKSDAIYDASATGPYAVTSLELTAGYGVILQVWRTGGALKAHATIPALPPPPAAPSGLTVTPGDGYLDVEWDAVSGATGYDVRAKRAGAADWHDVANNVTETSHRYTTTETIDYVAVRARNADGPGNWTELWRGPAHDWLNTVQQSGGASAASAEVQNQLAAPMTLTVTRDNARDEKLHVSWAAVSGASGYNLTCSVSPGWNAPGGSGWWHCGSTTSATSLTVDNGKHGDLVTKRSYLVAVRAVTSNPADASDWKRSKDIRPVFGELRNLTYSRSDGSIALSWRPHFWTSGYRIYCDDFISGQAPVYTLCATLTDQDDTDAEHSATLSSWTAGGTDYNIDNTKTYDIKIVSTNQWGDNEMLVPLIYPELLTVSNIGVTTATLTIVSQSGNWYYQADQSPDNTCKGPVNGSTKDLTGLTAHTNYIYSAYSDSACSAHGRIDAAPQFTTLSSVSNLASTKSGDANISDSDKQAVAFTTGSNSNGYLLKSVTMPLRTKVNRTGLTLTLHAMEGSGPYSSSSAPSSDTLATLTGTAPTASTWTDTVYTCSGSGCNLSPGATYFVVATGASTTAFAWAYALAETETALPSNNGWSVGYGHHQQQNRDWASWPDWNVAEIVFAHASGVTTTGATGTDLAWSNGQASTLRVPGWRIERDATGVLRAAAKPNPAPAASRASAVPTPGSRDAANDVTTLAAAGNTAPDGLWSDGATLWVVDTDDRMLYAYDLASKARDAGKDVILSRNTRPLGLASDGITLWVSDYQAGTVYAYPVPGAASAPGPDVTLHPANASPSALWTDGATLWVAEDTEGRLYAYRLSDGLRAPGKDLTLHADNASSGGLWSDGVTMWVSDPEDGRVYAYRLSDGRRDASREYVVSGGSARVYGLWSDGWTLWVVDDGLDRVLAHHAH